MIERPTCRIEIKTDEDAVDAFGYGSFAHQHWEICESYAPMTVVRACTHQRNPVGVCVLCGEDS